MGLFGPKTKEDCLRKIASLERDLAEAKALKAKVPASTKAVRISCDKQYYAARVESIKGEIAELKVKMKLLK